MGKEIIGITKNQMNAEIETLEKTFDTVRVLKAEEVGGLKKDCTVGENENCYEIWGRNQACPVCISYRALTEKRQFCKVEKTKAGAFQVFADYREVDGKPCVVEMIKHFKDDVIVYFTDDERRIETANDYFERSYSDILCETFNRRYYEESLAGESFTGGVAMIDLDDFKIYNDLFGHDAGDAVLKAVAKTIRKCVRSTDKVIRYGGDEFLIVAGGMTEVSFNRCMRDISDTVRSTVIDEYPSIKPTVSVGGVLCVNETLKDAVGRADEFMYLAKKKKDCAVGEKDKRAIKSAAKFTPAKETVLIVDDSDINREILVSILKNEYDLIEAADGEECINKLNEYGTRISAVLLDLIMPNMNGFDVLDYMNKNDLIGEIPVITITGDESQDTVRVAYEKGVSDYITRPFDAKVVYRRVSNTIKVYSRQKRLIFELKSQMREKEKNRDMIVEILCRIIEKRGGYVGNHASHITEFTRLLLEKLVSKKNDCDIKAKDIFVISTAAALHDLGKVQIDRAIIDKKGKLTNEEFEIIKTHTTAGEEMLIDLADFEDEPLVNYARQICRYHHERYDGKGYPDGLKGDEIPIAAQVVSVCDVYDALISERPYKRAYTHDEAVKMIKNGECGAFNPMILECFDECSDKFGEIIEREKKENSDDD